MGDYYLFVCNAHRVPRKDVPPATDGGTDLRVCPLCENPYADKTTDEVEQPVITQCGHYCGENCFREWTRESVECPYCHWDLIDLGDGPESEHFVQRYVETQLIAAGNSDVPEERSFYRSRGIMCTAIDLVEEVYLCVTDAVIGEALPPRQGHEDMWKLSRSTVIDTLIFQYLDGILDAPNFPFPGTFDNQVDMCVGNIKYLLPELSFDVDSPARRWVASTMRRVLHTYTRLVEVGEFPNDNQRLVTFFVTKLA